MIHTIIKDKPTKLFLGFTAFFVANALIAEAIGTKLFSLEKLFGAHPVNFTLFGQGGLSFTLTCGVLLWPLEFVITDIVNEYYGPKAVRRISITAVILISYAFLMYFLAIRIPPADVWLNSSRQQGVENIQSSFNAIFGQNMRIIIGSLVAFLVSQLVDVTIFHKIKKITGDKHLWLRATGSTLVSQLVDSYIVLFIAFSGIFSWQLILAVGIMNYTYKFTMAIILTPLIYFVERKIEKYVGHDTAKKMKRAAMGYEDDGFVNIPTAG
ncbi:MAG TPA: queuosine precursor transporter [Chitinophagaceae bacterium]|nr:queuosine precursor transporter [Chitinophagaceae bacterium]